MSTLDYDYDEYKEDSDFFEAIYPTPGTYQVVKILKAEFRVSNKMNSDASWFALEGTYPEFKGTKFFSALWVPRDQGDADRLKEDQSKFLGQLKKMDIPLKRGMEMDDVAELLVGRFARAKIFEDEDKKTGKFYCKPGYLGALKGDQIKNYPQPGAVAPEPEDYPDDDIPQQNTPRRSFGSKR
jgi:hypothetical protein